jgi:hypothetical protein
MRMGAMPIGKIFDRVGTDAKFQDVQVAHVRLSILKIRNVE